MKDSCTNGVVTMAEALGASGYGTYMSGKWHLADNHNYDAQAPNKRGFDRSFTLITGGASHFGDQKPISPVGACKLPEDGERIEKLPQDFYSTINYTDKLLSYLQDHDQAQPLLRLPGLHGPPMIRWVLPDEWSDRYAGAYDQGPIATHDGARADRQEQLGLLPEGAGLWQYPAFPGWFPNHRGPWSERDPEQRKQDARRMEIYASMVELLDQQVGRVVAHLESTGQLDNTYVIFFSDNGASFTGPFVYPGVTPEWFEQNWKNDHEARGQPGNFGVQGREWASVSVTPFKLYKVSGQ